ncbi:proline--tRNA ligase [Verminephrobacter aporrectodeae subsp. tuberculatae]|uniref:His/Gly/Thr/Pro-type tRNA ligase C-terminal domain-containing protein n=1 Tax=Verminephrobacter aporrectodeae TaxID=1110389 RepID=UPI002243F90F|nr:His/Gly/Thr/Pro-type tRNA ligase C-terminal domain-containing protein [Verminephrobacter aporrectodeae]MCW8208018.1 proline--tRNA ligase [Verminephrobacter aporrectodeae subsp. tuberculatae]
MHAIHPTREQDYSEWYQQVIREADLAETSPARGCMIIKPLGYGLWENMQQTLDRMFKDTGHQNVYFPLFIPLSFFEKEAAHVEGFAKECAVVTHRRLEAKPGGGLQPAGELEEPLIVRPTSETIIGAAFAKWKAGTSHFLGQNFARASEIKFQNEAGQEEFAWTTSWGVSTRLIGALIMTHGDDDGLVIPPRLAPHHVVILPIQRNEADRVRVMEYCERLAKELRAQPFGEGRVRVEIDARNMGGGGKTWSHIKRCVPIRLEIGPRDLDAGSVTLGRRDRPAQQRESMAHEQFVSSIGEILEDMQSRLFQRALAFRREHTREITEREEFERWYAGAEEGIHGGFALCPFVDDPRIAAQLAALKVSVRCIPFEQAQRRSACLFTGKPTDQWAIFARAY